MELLAVAEESVNQGALVYRFLPDEQRVGSCGTIRSNYNETREWAQLAINKWSDDV